MTAEDYAPYGVGEPDADGWYPDYRIPAELRAPAPAPESAGKRAEIDYSLLALVSHWQIVVAELIERGIDLYDPAVRARPWPGVRTAIFALIDAPTRLRRALTKHPAGV